MGEPSLFAFEFQKMLLTESRQDLNVAAWVGETTKDSKKVQKKGRKNFFGALLTSSCVLRVWCSSRTNTCWEEKVGFLSVGPDETLVT